MSSEGDVREQLAPYIGERVVDLLARALRGEPVTDDLTEAEALLIAWGHARAAGAGLSAADSERFERTFTPTLRAILDEFAA